MLRIYRYRDLVFALVARDLKVRYRRSSIGFLWTMLQPLLMIECPRLLFPFAREIVAAAVRNGGFPPLLLDPVDFVALYQQRAAQVQAQQPSTPTS